MKLAIFREFSRKVLRAFCYLLRKFRSVALRMTVNVQAALELSKEVRHGINSH